MKKLFVAVMLFTSISIFSGATAQAAYTERTDAYALDYYKYSAYSDDPAIVAEAQKITAGITDDYEKVRAIYQWAWNNITYTWDIPEGLEGIEQFKYGVCDTFASTTMYLAQAAGFPAKVVGGVLSEDGHDWNEIYVDGRWVFIDATNGKFDTVRPLSYTDYDYSLQTQDEEAWTGSLYFYDIANDKVLKEVKNFPINGVVNSTYGFDIKNLYFDKKYKKQFTLNTMKVNSQNCVIVVKPSVAKQYKVTLKSGSTVLKIVNVKENSKITKPANPTRKGYKFVGWYKTSSYTKTWNFATDKVTKNTTLYAKWMKK